MRDIKAIGGSFRDPHGFVFVFDRTVYRQVNARYQRDYDKLISSGLYHDLVTSRLLVAHTDVTRDFTLSPDAYKVIRPQQLPFISYPYEWCFSQLKDAALTTLEILRRALGHGLILKDASAYNIQFWDGKPLLIDTLSFESYQEGQAWIAYKQFCQHFLAPLVLMSHKDISLSQLLRVHMDGIPLGLAASLLPKRAWFNTGVVIHLLLQARAIRRYAGRTVPLGSSINKRLNKKSLLQIVDHLRATIAGLSWQPGRTPWAEYYEGDSYAQSAFEHKQELVSRFLDIVNPMCVWDLGGNTGVFSRIAAAGGAFTVSIDSDPGAVEANYMHTRSEELLNIHPLLIDLANPSAGIGWANKERKNLTDRSKADCILSLALIHHIAISNNVPLKMIAEFFSALAEWLIIEFVPKGDKKVQLLLASRKDIFDGYSQIGFETSFAECYELVQSQKISSSDRVLYLFRRRERRSAYQ